MKARQLAETAKRKLLEFSISSGSRRQAAERLARSGLSISWMLKFMNGEISNPTVDSLDALIEALEESSETVRPH